MRQEKFDPEIWVPILIIIGIVLGLFAGDANDMPSVNDHYSRPNN